jgi:ribosomal protein S18 acetylase RimI-like enzyme
MFATSAWARPELTLRWMVELDLPHVVRLSRQKTGLHWTHEDFQDALRALDTVGHVAEAPFGVVGFLLYRVRRDDDFADQDTGFSEDGNDCLGPRSRPRLNTPSVRPLQIDILNIAVDPLWQHMGIGRALLAKLDLKIQREPGCIRTLVPETNLAAQLFLRNFGYRATRVCRNHFEGEDAYLMERWALGCPVYQDDPPDY